MAFTAEVTEKVRQETSLPFNAWQASMSPEFGTVTWGVFVESLEELEAAQDKLAVSDSFTELAEKGWKLFVGPLTDGLASVVHGARDPEAPLPSYISVARATAATGRLGDAIAAGIEIAETGARITGIPMMFLAISTGPFGSFRWTSGAPDIGALERSETALMADPAWVALIDRIGAVYQEGVSQSIYRRII